MMFSFREENIMGKVENASYEHFFFTQFSKSYVTHYHTIPTFDAPEKEAF